MIPSKIHFAAAVLAIGLATPLHAATVVTGGTGSSGTGGFEVLSASSGGTDIFDVGNFRYDYQVTDPASNWVWNVQSGAEADAQLTFGFAFSTDGYDLSTLSLDGLWGVDNIGTVYLNGFEISALSIVQQSNFNTLTAFSAGYELFQDGDNLLSFEVQNAGSLAAFRAAFTVTGELAPIPLPAALPLTLAGLGALAALRRRRKNT